MFKRLRVCVCVVDGLLVQPVTDSLTHIQIPLSAALAQHRPAKAQNSVASPDHTQLHLGKTRMHAERESILHCDIANVLCLEFVPDFEHVWTKNRFFVRDLLCALAKLVHRVPGTRGKKKSYNAVI